MIFITISLLLCIISPRHFSAISTSDISFNEKWSTKSQSDDYYMLEALSLAKLAQGRTRPNPIVGCVIVAPDCNGTDKIVGKGFHKRSGESHAEVLALAEAGSLANGSTAYVSLEPCNHYGRTPPCTLALLRHGVKRVVAGMVDPDPRVSGSGLKMLQDHGVQATVIGNSSVGDMCRAANAAFVFRVTRRRPYSIVFFYNNESNSCDFLREESAAAVGSRLLRSLCLAASEADTMIASCEQWRTLTRHKTQAGSAQSQSESVAESFDPASVFPPDHCTIVVTFPHGCDEQDWAEVLQSVCDDTHSRQFVLVCHSFVSAFLDSIRKLSSQVRDRIRLVQLRNLSCTHNSSSEDDFGHVDMLSTVGNIHVIRSSNESLGNGNGNGNGSLESEIFANKTLLEFLSDHIGSNAVIYAVDTATQLDRCLHMDAVQRLVIADRGEDAGGKHPTFLPHLLKHYAKNHAAPLPEEQPDPDLVHVQEDSITALSGNGSTINRTSSSNMRKRNPLRLWSCNFWSP